MLKLLCGAAALACMITPALAYDADPASFRANPQAWVRNTLMPGCKAPGPLDVAACNCMVPPIASRITEADVVRVNEPNFAEAIIAKTKLPYVTIMCMKGLSPN